MILQDSYPKVYFEISARFMQKFFLGFHPKSFLIFLLYFPSDFVRCSSQDFFRKFSNVLHVFFYIFSRKNTPRTYLKMSQFFSRFLSLRSQQFLSRFPNKLLWSFSLNSLRYLSNSSEFSYNDFRCLTRAGCFPRHTPRKIPVGTSCGAREAILK